MPNYVQRRSPSEAGGGGGGYINIANKLWMKMKREALARTSGICDREMQNKKAAAIKRSE